MTKGNRETYQKQKKETLMKRKKSFAIRICQSVPMTIDKRSSLVLPVPTKTFSRYYGDWNPKTQVEFLSYNEFHFRRKETKLCMCFSIKNEFELNCSLKQPTTVSEFTFLGGLRLQCLV